MAQGSNRPIIIKRKKVVSGGGHHGGAWKVAYADFVTAMMAFFMLMWLLNATTEQQRKGLSDYFAPTIPVNRVSGGGSGAFGGDNIFSAEALAQSGTGARGVTTGDQPLLTEADRAAESDTAAQVAILEQIEAVLLGQGGESLTAAQALRHIVTRLTDEGLVVEIFDLPDSQLFVDDTAEPTPVTVEIATMLARLFAIVSNPVAINGHLSARPVPLRDTRNWDLSTERAAKMRILLENSGLAAARIVRQTGAADRKPATSDLLAVRNNRIEVILLRSDP